LRQVVRVCQRELLVGGLQRRRAVVLELQRGRVLREFGREVPLRQVEAGREPGVPAKPRLRVAVEVEATLRQVLG